MEKYTQNLQLPLAMLYLCTGFEIRPPCGLADHCVGRPGYALADRLRLADNECIALEVKSGRRHMNSGLNVFANAFHPTHSYVIGTGGIPFEDFFQMPVEQLF